MRLLPVIKETKKFAPHEMTENGALFCEGVEYPVDITYSDNGIPSVLRPVGTRGTDTAYLLFKDVKSPITNGKENEEVFLYNKLLAYLGGYRYKEVRGKGEAEKLGEVIKKTKDSGNTAYYLVKVKLDEPLTETLVMESYKQFINEHICIQHGYDKEMFNEPSSPRDVVGAITKLKTIHYKRKPKSETVKQEELKDKLKAELLKELGIKQ